MEATYMDFQLGAEVRQSDGGILGDLQRVIVDPNTTQVVSLVVFESGVDGREVLVPLDVVSSADVSGIDLAMDQDQFGSLEGFTQAINVAPPPDASNLDKDNAHELLDVPEALPIGAATGIESIAYTPVIEEVLNVPAGDILLDGDTTVHATDGEVGRFLSVRSSDATAQVESLIVTHGLVAEHYVQVPWRAVQSFELDTIMLSAARTDLLEFNNE